MQFFELVGGGGADRGDASAAQVAHVMEMLEEIIEKGGDSIGAGEDEPVVRVQLQQSVHQVLLFGRRLQFDGWNLHYFSAQFKQPPGNLRGLLATSCNNNALAKKRTVLEPVQFLA